MVPILDQMVENDTLCYTNMGPSRLWLCILIRCKLNLFFHITPFDHEKKSLFKLYFCILKQKNLNTYQCFFFVVFFYF